MDAEHLVAARALSEGLGSRMAVHLVLEVIAYADDEAEATGRRGSVEVTLRGDEVSVSDDGRGTDTRFDDSGRPVRKPVMATRDVRFFDADDPPLLPDGLPRRGMSTVAAVSPWLVHENRRSDGAWRQGYRFGIPGSTLEEVERPGPTGTTVTFGLPSPHRVDPDRLASLVADLVHVDVRVVGPGSG